MDTVHTRRQRVCLLGATGSVGTSTLDVLGRHPERFEVFALTAHSRLDELQHQCLQWRPRFAAVAHEGQARDLRGRLKSAGLRTEVLSGAQALCDLAGVTPAEVDYFMHGTTIATNVILEHNDQSAFFISLLNAAKKSAEIVEKRL